MAIKPDKSRIMFTTESSFESFLKDRCFIENRNMSNLVDTILKSHYEEEYKIYVSSIDAMIKAVVRSNSSQHFCDDFMSMLNNSKIPFSTKVSIRNTLAHSSEDIKTTIINVKNLLEEDLQKGVTKIEI